MDEWWKKYIELRSLTDEQDDWYEYGIIEEKDIPKLISDAENQGAKKEQDRIIGKVEAIKIKSLPLEEKEEWVRDAKALYNQVIDDVIDLIK